METAEQFYEAFGEAGFLKSATWTPLNGAAAITRQVRFRAPTRELLGGDAFDNDYTVEYPATHFPGLKRGEVLAIVSDPVNALVDGNYRLRQDPRSELDGSVHRAFLEKF